MQIQEEIKPQAPPTNIKQCKYCDKWYSEVVECKTKICPECFLGLQELIFN